MRKSIRIIAGAAFVLAAASCEKTLDEPINESAQETRALTKSGDNNQIEYFYKAISYIQARCLNTNNLNQESSNSKKS